MKPLNPIYTSNLSELVEELRSKIKHVDGAKWNYIELHLKTNLINSAQSDTVLKDYHQIHIRIYDRPLCLIKGKCVFGYIKEGEGHDEVMTDEGGLYSLLSLNFPAWTDKVYIKLTVRLGDTINNAESVWSEALPYVSCNTVVEDINELNLRLSEIFFMTKYNDSLMSTCIFDVHSSIKKELRKLAELIE